MSPENKHTEPEPSQLLKTDGEFFDSAAADRERLALRLGGEEPTERALGRDETLARETQDEIERVRGLRADAKSKLVERLGGVASAETRSDNN